MRSEFMDRLKENKLAMSGLCVVLWLVAVAILAPLITPFAPNDINVDSILLNPSWTHPFGTDELGRDVYTRMVYGARISLYVGIIAAGLATLIGVILGSLAGYYGGWVETVIMRFTDIMLCFPSFF
jgi:peptide/nickel transport system permease protein